MGIGSYNIYDNTIDYQDYWVGAASPPPKNATNEEGCGCYIVKKRWKWKGMGNIHYILHLPLSLQKSHELIQRA